MFYQQKRKLLQKKCYSNRKDETTENAVTIVNNVDVENAVATENIATGGGDSQCRPEQL